jgi:hypothetical protein
MQNAATLRSECQNTAKCVISYFIASASLSQSSSVWAPQTSSCWRSSPKSAFFLRRYCSSAPRDCDRVQLNSNLKQHQGVEAIGRLAF